MKGAGVLHGSQVKDLAVVLPFEVAHGALLSCWSQAVKVRLPAHGIAAHSVDPRTLDVGESKRLARDISELSSWHIEPKQSSVGVIVDLFPYSDQQHVGGV